MSARKKTGKTREAMMQPAVDAQDDNGISKEQQRQVLLLTLERKYRTLMHCSQELNGRLADPSAPRVEIETHLAANGIERQALLARHDVIEKGDDFRFPSETEIEKLRTAMGDLETQIAQAAATEALIKAGNRVIRTVKASTTVKVSTA